MDDWYEKVDALLEEQNAIQEQAANASDVRKGRQKRKGG